MDPDLSGRTGKSHLGPAAADESTIGRWLAGIVTFGFGLRLLLVALAENRLDCDEATVALMSLDILEHGATPMFFYGGAYNGGGALEAYLGAGAASLGLLPPLGLKGVLALLWLVAAGLFANLCQRSLPRTQALVATLFLAVGTPFFLEWSLKARGGFAETLLLSILLLWLAHPPRPLVHRPTLQCILFGLTGGLGVWASEMILPMLPCAALWLLSGFARNDRLRAGVILVCAGIVGVTPLAAYNLGHDWEQLQQSATVALLAGRALPVLDLSALNLSFHFVLGSAAWLFAIGVAIGTIRILRRRTRLELGHVLLLHAALYLFAYWVSGLRFLEIPPSRVLYPLQINIAVLLAWAIDWRPGIRRRASFAAVILWLILALGTTSGWLASGTPRDHASWRATWCGVDGESLLTALLGHGVDTAYMSYWTATPVLLANRMAKRNDATAPTLRISTQLDATGEPTRRVAVVLQEGSPVLSEVETAIQNGAADHERTPWGSLVILSGFNAKQLENLEGLPANFSDGARPPHTDPNDGFN